VRRHDPWSFSSARGVNRANALGASNRVEPLIQISVPVNIAIRRRATTGFHGRAVRSIPAVTHRLDAP
jgi:hypothetical protein